MVLKAMQDLFHLRYPALNWNNKLFRPEPAIDVAGELCDVLRRGDLKTGFRV